MKIWREISLAELREGRTLGLWQTGYFEFHQETGLSGVYSPQPTYYPCSICGESFDSEDSLFEHRFESHPFKRPTLLLNGIEVNSARQLIVHQLSPEAITFGHVINCYLNNEIIVKNDLREYLANKTRGLCSVVLKTDGVESSYQLDFDVPDKLELMEVEQVFFDIVGGGVLDLDRINLFIDMTLKFSTASRFVDGLSNYLYGILAKDQRGGTQLEISEFITKFNQALDTLRLFERPLTQSIVGVVNFNQNVFDSALHLGAAPKARLAMLKFNSLVTGIVTSTAGLKMDTPTSYKKIPLDSVTEKIFEWALMPFDELLKNSKELENSLKSQNWMASDKFKVQMLLAEMLIAMGNVSAAIRIAGSSQNDAIFGPWAQRIIGEKE